MENRGGKDGNGQKASSGKELSLNAEQKVLLHQSVASYLERCGFSKTLKKFLSEAQIQKGDSEKSMIELEEMCLRYVQMGKDTNTVFNIHKDQDGRGNPTTTVGNMGNKKKKENNERDNSADSKHEVAERVEDSVHEKEIINNGGTESKLTVKDKKQELKKKKSDKLGDEVAPKNLADNIEDESLKQNPDNQSTKKKKSKTNADVEQLQTEVPTEDQTAPIQKNGTACIGKKKKKLKSTSDSVVGDETELKENSVKKVDKKKKKVRISESNLEEDSEKKEVQVYSNGDITVSNYSKTSNDDTTTTEKKESKKRKRSTSEDALSVVDEKNNEKLENGKVESLQESPANEQSERVTVFDEPADKNVEKTIEENSAQRPAKKQRNGSQEPKTVKAFQRVKIDQVAYADERLQDNSYWALDGAECGYGAKAQEILGQVRGRGFRHEKTKKKRGTYRGGKIDLDSHSVKFNYSDDE